MNPQLYGQLFYYKGGKNIQWGKGILVNKCWIATCKRIILDFFLIPYTDINSKSLKDSNQRPRMIKLLGENIGSMLFDIGLSSFGGDMSPQVGK